MNGVIVIDKDKGYTSRDVVNKVGKILGTKKVGHTGTLDPIATGVLVLPIGKALKISELIVSEDKEYIARVIIGYETDTLDVTGEKTHEKKIKITRDDVLKVLDSFKGKIKQQVPKYAAVKINGKKLYEYAREGIDVELPVREVEIYELELISEIKEVDGYYEFEMRTLVSKGTYIRSLIRDIGNSLGSYGTMKELRRIKQGDFTIDMAYKISDIEKGDYKLLAIDEVLRDLPQVVVDDELLFKIKNGVVLDKFFDSDMALIKDKMGNCIAIYKNVSDKARVFKMF